MARQRPAESWNRTEEAPTSTSTASASLWEREARDGRKWGDVKTGRKGTAGRKSACTACRMRHPPTKTGAEPTNRAHGYDTKDRAVKRDEIRISTSGRSVDFLTIHRPAWFGATRIVAAPNHALRCAAWERAPAGIGPVGCLP